MFFEGPRTDFSLSRGVGERCGKPERVRLFGVVVIGSDGFASGAVSASRLVRRIMDLPKIGASGARR